MSSWFSKRDKFIRFVLCALPIMTSHLLMAQDTPAQEPDITSVPISEPFEMTFGPGPFNLLSPSAGLSALSSYRGTLTVSFEGTNTDQPLEWTRTYTLLVTQDPPARQLTIDASEDPAGQVIRAEINNTFYEWREGGACIASVIESGASLAERWELGSFLDSVIGAEVAGSESANGIPSDHYTFDESALGAVGLADSTGALWVASEGGYLVQYTLETTGGADYFGEGIEGTLTWDYQLGDVGLPLVIELPDDCPPGLLNLPMLPDAADILEFPGMTSYTTLANLEDALAFYQEQVVALGGQVDNPPLVMESAALFGFTLDDQPILLVANSDLAGTIIEMYEVNDPEQLAIVAEVPDERGAQAEPTEAASVTVAACEPGTSSVPITPDASSIQDMGIALSYMTAMSLADVAAFYEEQLAALGAQVSSPVPASDFMAMLNVQQNGQAYAITIGPIGATTNVTISAMTAQMTFTACMPESSTPAATIVSPDTESTESGGCPRGVLPLLPDAANIQDIPGLGAITYTTSASVPETVAFYEEQFAALGAQAVPQMPATEAMASPMFLLDNQPIVLIITAEGDGSTSVSISIMGNNPFRGAAPCG